MDLLDSEKKVSEKNLIGKIFFELVQLGVHSIFHLNQLDFTSPKSPKIEGSPSSTSSKKNLDEIFPARDRSYLSFPPL